jgi:hypothetical protein
MVDDNGKMRDSNLPSAYSWLTVDIFHKIQTQAITEIPLKQQFKLNDFDMQLNHGKL